MPFEADVIGNVSKEEEDIEKSNEQSITLTLNSANQDSNVSVKHIDRLANANDDRVSTSDIRTKFLNSTEDVLTTSDSSVIKNDFFETENLYPQDKTTGQCRACKYFLYFFAKCSFLNIVKYLIFTFKIWGSKNIFLKILDTLVPVKQVKKNDDSGTTCDDMVQHLNKKSILAHKNLSRNKGLLAESISEIHHNASELAVCSNIPDGKAHESEKSHNIDVEEYDCEPGPRNLCNNNIDVALDIKHKLIEETISLHTCKESLKDSDSMNHDSLVNILKTSSNDKDCNIDHDSNLSADGLTSLSLEISKESLSSQSATSANHSDATDDAKVSLNTLDNKSLLENVIGNELSISSICKEISQEAGCASYNDSNTNKPFKLPILEKMPKIVSVQRPEVEENAVALLDSSFTRQSQLEGVRCLDLEPRSSNSSEESNSDLELQHASTSNDKKVSKLHLSLLCFHHLVFF